MQTQVSGVGIVLTHLPDLTIHFEKHVSVFCEKYVFVGSSLCVRLHVWGIHDACVSMADVVCVLCVHVWRSHVCRLIGRWYDRDAVDAP